MKQGTATLDRTWENWLLFSWGSSQLVFHDPAKGKVWLMDQWEESEAFLCPACGALTVATRGADNQNQTRHPRKGSRRRGRRLPNDPALTRFVKEFTSRVARRD